MNLTLSSNNHAKDISFRVHYIPDRSLRLVKEHICRSCELPILVSTEFYLIKIYLLELKEISG